MHIQVPAGARYIIEELNRAGYEAYIVGGCVRDCLLGKMPNDWDITTSAKPEEVKALFERTIDTGIQHGTVTVLVPREVVGVEHAEHTDYAFEVTTYRVDGRYADHRHPTGVTFTASLEEDLKRRDFTINAMAYNDRDGVIDMFQGQQDLADGVIRCVGVAGKRFDEDALRILRAVRFAAQLDFSIEEETKLAMRKQAHFLEHISAERIQAEFTKLITSEHPERIEEAYELGLTKVFLPEFDAMMGVEQNNPYHMYTVGKHTIEVLKHVPGDTVLRYSALLHDVGKPVCRTTDARGVDHFRGHQKAGADMAKKILRRLKMDNETIERVQRLVLNHDFGIQDGDLTLKGVRRFLARLGTEHFDDYMCIRRADVAGQSSYQLQERKLALVRTEEMYRVIQEERQCLRMADMEIDGKTLIQMGIAPGPMMGKILRELFERVLENPELNKRDCLMEIVRTEYMEI